VCQGGAQMHRTGKEKKEEKKEKQTKKQTYQFIQGGTGGWHA